MTEKKSKKRLEKIPQEKNLYIKTIRKNKYLQPFKEKGAK
jgi:hypothetical protein